MAAHQASPMAMMRSHSNGSAEHAYKRSSRASDTSSSLYSGDGGGDPSLHDSSLLDSDDDADFGVESVSSVNVTI